MPTFDAGRDSPNRFCRPAVREEHVVRGRERVVRVRASRRVLARPVPEPRGDPRLVVRDPVGDAVAEPLRDCFGVPDERFRGRARGPAALVLERLRQIPVVQGRERRHPLLEQLVDEPVVEVEPRLVHLAAPFREDARPRDREAEGVEPELAHQPDVVGEAVVEVARDRAALAVPHLPRRRTEPIPDALAAAVLVDGAFDLVRRGRGAPGEIGWKRGLLGHAACLLTKWSGRSSTSAVPAPRSPTLRPARAPSGACESPRSGCGTAESRSLV